MDTNKNYDKYHNSFRDELGVIYEKNKINFSPTLSIQNGKRRRIFNDGPQITFDSGYTFTNLFEILQNVNKTKPTRAQLTKYLSHKYGVLDSPGLYLIEAKNRRMVITTKSIVKSYAKVLYELLHTDEMLDTFLKRLSASPQISFKVLYIGKTNHRMGATYAGIYDTMNPAIALTSTSFNYRKFKYAYRKGLVAGGNFVSLAIEKELANGSRPSFISREDAFAWNPEFYEIEVMPDDVFDRKVFALINDSSRIEFRNS